MSMLLDFGVTDLDGDTLVFRLFERDASKFSLDPLTRKLVLPTVQTNPRGSFDGDNIVELT